MQISSIIQPAEFNPQGIPPAEKAETNKIEVQKKAPADLKEDNESLTELQEALTEHSITLSYSRDDKTNQLVIKLVDEKTGEALQQFPSEVSLKLAAVYSRLQGQFVDKTY